MIIIFRFLLRNRSYPSIYLIHLLIIFSITMISHFGQIKASVSFFHQRKKYLKVKTRPAKCLLKKTLSFFLKENEFLQNDKNFCKLVKLVI